MTALHPGRLVGAALLGYAVNSTVVAPQRLRVHDVALQVPGWPQELSGLRIAVVGDVHAGSPWFPLPRVQKIVDQVVQARPDLIVLLGDHMVDVTFGRNYAPREIAQVMARLRDAAPVVGVLGNHDWDHDGESVRAAFESAGLPVLEESAMPVLDGRLWVAGVGDLWRRKPSVPQALEQVPAGAPVVLLTHNPDVVLKAPAHVQLVLAGHTHGGQFRFRGKPVHRISRKHGNRWSHGWYPADRLYVTPGIGTSKYPIRNVVPEVPVLVLHPG